MRVNVYGSSLAAWVATACLAKVGNEVVINETMACDNKELNDISVIRDEAGLLDELQRQMDQGRVSRQSKDSIVKADIY